MLLRTALSVSTLALLASCSIVAGTTDERVRGPSAPAIAITPETPRTLDDLRVDVTEESVDRRGFQVTYHYAWTRDGSGEIVSEAESLPNTLTQRDQVWTVTVTPEADGRRGTPAQATVTIENTPPTLAYAGLSRYDLVRDETVEVFVGPSTDPDGDLVTRSIAWRVNGAPIALSASQISLPTLPAVGGEQIEVTVTPNDGTNVGAPVTVGPARVRAPGVQWRPIAPARSPGQNGFERGTSLYDAANRRWLHFAQRVSYAAGLSVTTEVWEYGVDVHRWARLLPSNPEVGNFLLPYTGMLMDAAHHRVVFYSMMKSDFSGVRPEVCVFDVSRRGAESWRSLPLSATSASPPVLAFSSAVLDGQRDRIVAYGGVSDIASTPTFANSLWELTLGEADATWRSLGDVVGFGPVVGATWVLDAKNDAAYLAGGALPAGDSFPPTTERLDIWRFDLEANTFDPNPVATLDAPLIMAGGVTLADDRSAWFVHGIPSFDANTPSSLIRRLDLDTFELTQVTLSGDVAAVAPSNLPGVAYDPADKRVHFAPNPQMFGGPPSALSFTAIAADGNVEATDWYAVSSPPALSRLHAVYETSGKFSFYFGKRAPSEVGTSDALASADAWSFSPLAGFERVVLPGQPTGRYDYAFGTMASEKYRYFVGGSRVSLGAPVVIQDVYEYGDETTPPWRFRGTVVSSPAAPSVDLSRAVVGPCGNGLGTSFTFGGQDTSAGREPISIFDVPSCTGNDCTFTAVTSGLPTPVEKGTAVLVEGKLWVLGGSSHGGVLRYGDPCGSTWSSVTLGTLPSSMPFAQAFALDNKHIIVIGVWSEGGTTLPFDVGILDITTPSAPVYTAVIPADGITPPSRFHFAADSAGSRRVMMYGGDSDSIVSSSTVTYSDLWELYYDPVP